jgi:hypothetical protein
MPILADVFSLPPALSLTRRSIHVMAAEAAGAAPAIHAFLAAP